MASAEHRANTLTVVAVVVVVRVRTPRIEVEFPRVVRVRRVERRRPVVAVRTLIAERSVVAVACGGKENACCFCGGSLLIPMGEGVFMSSM